MKGNRIQADVISPQLHHDYDNSIQEESVYEFETFKVSRNGYKYKATNHPYRITFTSKTFFAPADAGLPKYSWDFWPISKILFLSRDDEAEHLIGNILLN